MKKIQVGLSHAPIDKNEQGVWGRVKYETVGLTVDELLERVLQGYAVSNVFDGKRCNDNFKRAEFVFLDFDDYEIDFEAFWQSVPKDLKPTIAYTTANNRVGGKGNRFRFLYAFYEPILSKPLFERVYDALCERLGVRMKDNCGRKPTQQMAGTVRSALWHKGEVFSVGDFVEDWTDYLKDQAPLPPKGGVAKSPSGDLGATLAVDAAFLAAWQSLSPSELLECYMDKPIEHSEPIAVYDTHSLYNKETYMEVYVGRRWYYDDEEGKMKCLIVKVADGQHRRAKLAMDANIIHKLKPSISAEELIINLVYRRLHFYENKDGVLTNQVLLNIVERELSNPNYAATEYRGKRRLLMTNRGWCIENGISRIALANTLNKEYRKAEVLADYDWSKSVKHNQVELSKLGIKVSYNTLRVYVREELRTETLMECQIANQDNKEKKEKQYNPSVILALLREKRKQGLLGIDDLNTHKQALPRRTYYRWKSEIEDRSDRHEHACDCCIPRPRDIGKTVRRLCA